MFRRMLARSGERHGSTSTQFRAHIERHGERPIWGRAFFVPCSQDDGSARRTSHNARLVSFCASTERRPVQGRGANVWAHYLAVIARPIALDESVHVRLEECKLVEETQMRSTSSYAIYRSNVELFMAFRLFQFLYSKKNLGLFRYAGC